MAKTRITITILCLLFNLYLLGCATTVVTPQQAMPVPNERIINNKYLASKINTATSTLIFVRDSGLYGVGVTIYLYINGEEIAGFRPSEKLQLILDPGEYLLGVQSRPNFGLEQFVETPIRIEQSREYSFRISSDYNKAIVQRTSAF
ncbi:MAG: hypothetical protein WBB23_20580 [Desulforhopalus sp.]